MVELKMPKWYKIDAQELQDGKWKLHYEEGFDPAHFEAWKLSAESFKGTGITPIIEHDRAIVDIEGPRRLVLNFLAGEFFMTSDLGQMRLGEIFAILTLKAAERSRDDTKAL